MSHNDKEAMFIFDDELCVEDEAHECIDGYLWAVDALVDRVKDKIKNELTEEELDTMDNINFYTYWNLKTDAVDLISTFWYFKNDVETHHSVQLYLSDAEAKELTSAMETYCQKRYGEGCLSFLNEARTHEGLNILEAPSDRYFHNTALSPKAMYAIDQQVDAMLRNKSENKEKLSLDEMISRAASHAHSQHSTPDNTIDMKER